jgi:hypothetical protein
MSKIPGTNVASGIVPFTTEDEFPTHYSEYGKGGWREVQTIAERDSITTARRKIGMAVYVRETDRVYILKNGTSNEYWVPFDTGSGGSQTYVHNQGVAAASWVIEHNLERYPSVTVVTSAGTVVVGDVNYNNENVVTITFNGAFKGKAYLN